MTKTFTLIATIATLLGFGYRQHEYQYTLDRIEEGVNSDWAVIEVYDKCCDTITMIDVEIVSSQYPH